MKQMQKGVLIDCCDTGVVTLVVKDTQVTVDFNPSDAKVTAIYNASVKDGTLYMTTDCGLYEVDLFSQLTVVNEESIRLRKSVKSIENQAVLSIIYVLDLFCNSHISLTVGKTNAKSDYVTADMAKEVANVLAEHGYEHIGVLQFIKWEYGKIVDDLSMRGSVYIRAPKSLLKDRVAYKAVTDIVHMPIIVVEQAYCDGYLDNLVIHFAN